MRSDLIFKAKVHVSNRYQLARLVSRATRALHRPGTRIEDTMNDVLMHFSRANPVAASGSRSEQTGLSLHHRKPRTSSSLETGFEFGPMVRDQSVQTPRFADPTPLDSSDLRSLPGGVHPTALSPMPSMQRVE